MEKQRLIKLIENKGTSSKEETSELWDIVRTFPYFQTARLLLAKSLHNQSSIHFHNELKTASAYASDRKVLFHLINHETTVQKSEEKNNVFVVEEKPVLKAHENYSENQFALSAETEEQIESPVFEIKEEAGSFKESKKETAAPPFKYREEPEVRQEKVIEEKKNIPEPVAHAFDEPATTNEEIIRRRLNEILSKNKPQQEIIPEATPPKVDEVIDRKEEVVEEKSSQPESVVTQSVLDELPSEPVDAIEGLEIETIIEENYLQELEKLPEIAKPVVAEEQEKVAITERPPVASKEFSFIDWLKQKNGGHTTVEEVKDEPLFPNDQKSEIASSTLEGRGASELINQFIATKPRIAPVKAEFYSPANMARQSITDNEDIISETLARIYFDQGNYPKARSCYEKLTLLYPEKSASFAPLIEKIDNILNQIKD